MKKLKNVSLVGNTGNFDNKVDYAGSEGLDGVKVVNIKPHVDPFVFPVVLSLSLFRKQLDKKVATLQLRALSAAITVCAQEHADYLGVIFEGPFAQCNVCSSRLYRSLERPRVDAVVLLRSKRVLPLRRFGIRGT